MKLVIDIPDNEIPKRQEILSIYLHFIDGKVCECTYPFEEIDIPTGKRRTTRMTNKEAQNEIVRNKGVFKYDPTMTEALDIAIKAIEQQLKCGCNICEYYPMKEERSIEHWISKSDDIYGFPTYLCSNCQCEGSLMWKYCPHCGAKMKKEEVEE